MRRLPLEKAPLAATLNLLRLQQSQTWELRVFNPTQPVTQNLQQTLSNVRSYELSYTLCYTLCTAL